MILDMPRKRTTNPPGSWAAKLTKLQDSLELDNHEMAEHLEVSLHTYLAWKYGKRKPSGFALRALKDKLK